MRNAEAATLGRRLFEEVRRIAPLGALRLSKEWLERHGVAQRQNAAIEQLVRSAKRMTEECLGGVRSIQDWLREREEIRERTLWMLGLSPLPERTDLKARISGRLDRGAYRIEKIVFEPIPGLLATALFYKPDTASEVLPCVLYLTGHWPSPHGSKTGLQDRYLWYPENGFACLVLDPLEFGEVPGIHHGTQNLSFWHWLSLGYTPLGIEVWKAMRALDWLEARSEVDSTRVGVTGISGGGVASWLVAALDERVRTAAPSCATYTIGSQAAGGLIQEQCDCTFYPNVYGVDLPAVGALIAPRPLLMTNGRKDPVFPPAGFDLAYAKLRKIYGLYGEGETRLRTVSANVGHADTAVTLEEVRKWMGIWLAEEKGLGAERNAGPRPEKAELLRCLPEAPGNALNYHIHDVFVRGHRCVAPQNAGEWNDRRREVQRHLKDTVFRWLQDLPTPGRTRILNRRGPYAEKFAECLEASFESEPNVWVRVRMYQPPVTSGGESMLLVVRGDRDLVAYPDLDEVLPLLPRTTVVVLYPRFTEQPLLPPAYAGVERLCSLIGRTVAGLQIWDTIQALRWAIDRLVSAPSRIHVFGRAGMGVVGLYAALMEERFNHVILSDPPESHWQGPALLTVLRQTDLPEVLGMLCPRQVTFLRTMPSAYELTAEAFRVGGGTGGRLSVAPSLAAAVLPAR